MENANSRTEVVSPAQAVLLGALAPGVNDQTWSTLKIAFLMLGCCLLAMLGLAFSSSDSILILHVGLLVLIAVTLFLLLSRNASFIFCVLGLFDCHYLLIYGKTFTVTHLAFFLFDLIAIFLEQTGFVKIEQQMRELGLMPENSKESVSTKSD